MGAAISRQIFGELDEVAADGGNVVLEVGTHDDGSAVIVKAAKEDGRPLSDETTMVMLWNTLLALEETGDSKK